MGRIQVEFDDMSYQDNQTVDELVRSLFDGSREFIEVKYKYNGPNGSPNYARLTTVPDITPQERIRFLQGLGKTLGEIAFNSEQVPADVGQREA